MPTSSPNGFITAFFAVITGFALIWHIWWMSCLGLGCALLTLLSFGWRERTERTISSEQLRAEERARPAGTGFG